MTQTIELIEISEADIQLFVESFCCTREYAIQLLEAEQRMRIEYLDYLNSPIDPRD